MDALKEFFIKVSFDTSGFDKLRDNLNNLQENIKQSVGNGTKATAQNLTAMTTTLKGKFSQLADSIKGTFGRLFSGLKRQNKEYADSTKSMLSNLKNLFIGYLSFATIKGSISDFVDRGMLADEASSLLGITPERFDNIAKAFNRFGVEANALEGQLASLNQDIAEATKGGGKLIDLQKKFGISIHNASGEVMSADEMLLSMTEQLKDFDAKTRAGILRILGFDTAVQSAFSDGGEALMGFYKKQQDLSMITEKDTAMAKKWTFQLKDLKDQVDRIRNAIARFLLPIFTKIAELVTKFIEWIFKHKQAFIAILATIGVMLAPILGFLVKILATQIAILAPWVALGALIGGIVLVFEDIYYYFKGYKSMTGEFVKKWQFLDNILQIIKPLVVGIGETLEKIVEFFNEPSLENFLDIFVRLGDTIFEQAEKIVDILFGAFSEIGEMWNNIDWLQTFKDLFAVEWWSEKINIVKDAFMDAFKAVGDFFIGIFDGIISWVSDKIKMIMSPLEGVGNIAKGAVDSVKGFFGFGDKKEKETKETTGAVKGFYGEVEKTTGAIANFGSEVANTIKSISGFFGESLAQMNAFNNAPMVAPNNYATTTNNNSNQQIHINAYGVDNKTAGGLAKDIGSQIQGQQEQKGNVGRFK